MTKTKSPIKDNRLRYAAQSPDEAIDELLDEKVLYTLQRSFWFQRWWAGSGSAITTRLINLQRRLPALLYQLFFSAFIRFTVI